MPKADPSPAEELCRRIFSFACDLEEPLDQTLAFARALDLMGFGLRSIHNDHGPAFLTIAEALTDWLKTARKTWRLASSLRLA